MASENDERQTKYRVEMNQALGTVIGDSAQVEHHFHLPPHSPPHATINELLTAFRQASVELRVYPVEIAGVHIVRAEVSKIVDWALHADPKERLAMVLDQPGSGKTVVLHDVLEQLEAEGVPVVAVKSDFLSGIESRDALAARLGLPAPLEVCAHHLATEGLSVVLMDQLDALSLALTRDRATLDVMLSTLARLRDLDNVRIIASCRTFDLNNDPRLSQVKIDRKFQLQPLTDEQVYRVLQVIRIDPRHLLPAHRMLLTTPLHLEVYARIATGSLPGQTPEGYHTLQELYEAMWQKSIVAAPLDQPHPREHIAAIYRLVEAMQENRRLAAPLAVLDEYPEAATYLEHEDFIRKEGNNWLFYHHTLFDYCYARRFVSESRHLSDEILDGPQGLFERSQMVQILAYLRGADSVTYSRELTALLFSDRLRAHLSLLLIGWLGSLPNPTNEEVQIALRLMVTLEGRTRFFRAISDNVGWFEVLNKDRLPSMLESKDRQVVELAVGYLGTMIEARTEAVLSHLYPYLGATEEWDQRIAFCLSHLNNWQSEQAVDVLCELLDRGHIFEYVSSILYELYKSNPAAGCWALRVYLDKRLEDLLAHEAAGTELERAPLPGPLVRISDRYTWNQYLLGEYAIGKILERANMECPDQITEHVLPWFKWTAERLSESKRSDDDYPFDPLFASYWYGDHLSEGAAFAWQIAEALRHLAQKNPSAFRAAANGLTEIESLAVQRVLTHAYLSDPEEFANDIYAYLMADARRLKIGEPLESPRYDSIRLFVAAFQHVDEEQRADLEKLILELKPAWELRRRGRFGITQLGFLKDIPSELLTENGRRKRLELENKFPSYELRAPQGVTGGWVGPPIEPEAQTKMSDDAWLGAMRKYDDSTTLGAPQESFLKGGVYELSRSFSEQVKEDPERFYKLAQRFDETISLNYISGAITGLAESDCPANWVFDLVGRFLPRIEGEVRRYVCWALMKRAEDGVPDDLLDMMADWALHDPDPQEELWSTQAGGGQLYYGGDPHGHGINTNRGSAVRIVCRCAFNRIPRQVERAFQLLEKAADDPSTAVRTCIIDCLGPLLNEDANRTLAIFERTMDGHPALLQSLLIHRFLYSAYYRYFLRVGPFIEVLFDNADDNTRQAGARLVCLAAFDYPKAEGLANMAMTGDEYMRRGAAQVYSRNLEKEKLAGICRDHLLQLMNDPDEEVRNNVGECFMYLKSGHIDRVRSLIEAFLDSAALILGAQHLIEYLGPLAIEEHKLALRVTARILDMTGSDVSDFRSSAALLERDLVRLPLTVYTHAEDPIVKSQAMNLFERLLLLGSGAAHRALADWDRR